MHGPITDLPIWSPSLRGHDGKVAKISYNQRKATITYLAPFSCNCKSQIQIPLLRVLPHVRQFKYLNKFIFGDFFLQVWQTGEVVESVCGCGVVRGTLGNGMCRGVCSKFNFLHYLKSSLCSFSMMVK